MKTITNSRSLENSPNLPATSFGIKSKNLQHIIGILRDDIYSDKILAVIREYSCNAYDANVEAGNKNVPIKVYMPSRLSPELKIRDFGKGLSEQDIVDIYTSYGESTKRESNDVIGQLGIGSKSGFAYGDNFLVTSYYNGKKTIYNAALDATGVGSMVKLIQEDSNEPSGIEVSIPVKSGDESLFISKSVTFFKFWDVKPELIGIDSNITDKSPKVLISGNGWDVCQPDNGYNYTSYALMGNIAYPIKWELVGQKTEDLAHSVRKVYNFITSNSFVIKFNIGELQISPSRESLQYTAHTIKNISSKLEKIVTELCDYVAKSIIEKNSTWDRSIQYSKLFISNHYSHTELLRNISYIREGVESTLAAKSVKVKDLYINFQRWASDLGFVNDFSKVSVKDTSWIVNVGYHSSYKNTLSLNRVASSSAFYPHEKTKILILDSTRKTHVNKCMAWFCKNYGADELLVFKFGDDKVKEDFFKAYDFDGVPIVKFSDIFGEYKKTIPKRASHKTENNITRVNYVTTTSKYVSYRNMRYNKIMEGSVDLDLSTETGYYIPVEKESVMVNNQKMSLVDFLSTLYRLNDSLKEIKSDLTCGLSDPVYIFTKRVTHGKKFSKYSKNWKNYIEYLEKFVSSNVASISAKEAGIVRSTTESDVNCGIKLDKTIYNSVFYKIDDKNHVIYKLCDFLNTDRVNVKPVNSNEIVNCLQRFGYHNNDGVEQIKTQIKSMCTEIAKKYPMLMTINPTIPSNSIRTIVSDYINSIDKQTNN